MKNTLIAGLVIIGMSVRGTAAETTPTPITSKASDKRVSHQIHTAIVADQTLPYCAHVVNVEADKGKVTLQGKVHSEEEKEAVGEKAASLVGEKNVKNEIIVKERVSVAAR